MATRPRGTLTGERASGVGRGRSRRPQHDALHPGDCILADYVLHLLITPTNPHVLLRRATRAWCEDGAVLDGGRRAATGRSDWTQLRGRGYGM